MEYTLTMLDTTFREVDMENIERERIQNGKGELSGHLGKKIKIKIPKVEKIEKGWPDSRIMAKVSRD